MTLCHSSFECLGLVLSMLASLDASENTALAQTGADGYARTWQHGQMKSRLILVLENSPGPALDVEATTMQLELGHLQLTGPR